jgi:hypothetical protein
MVRIRLRRLRHRCVLQDDRRLAGLVVDERRAHYRRPGTGPLGSQGEGQPHSPFGKGSQYLSIRCTERLAEMDIAAYVGSAGDAYDIFRGDQESRDPTGNGLWGRAGKAPGAAAIAARSWYPLSRRRGRRRRLVSLPHRDCQAFHHRPAPPEVARAPFHDPPRPLLREAVLD